MSAQKPIIAFFKDIQKEDVGLVGGKGANLGEMANADFPVPGGFAVTVEAYDLFIAENNLFEEISVALKGTNVNSPEELEDVSKKIQKKVLNGKVPDLVFKEIHSAYKKLSGPFKKALVAVRSSATAEDLPGMSFAGQQATFLNVRGEAALVDAVRECWASLFTARAIFYRVQNKISHDKVKLSAIVQKMIESEVSGVMFTLDPVTNDKDRIVIESVWGLGEMIVQGSVVPDHYVVQKDTFAILSKEISDQVIQLVRHDDGNKEIEVPLSIRDKQKLPDEAIKKLAEIGDKIQKHYYFPQDIEWSWAKGKLYIIQSRPVTTMGTKTSTKVQKSEGGETAIPSIPTVVGLGASPGIASGPVKILKSPKEIGKVVKGDVLVAPMTSPDYVPAMKKAAAIVTDEGGPTSHAAIVSRELGIPAVVGTKDATKKLKEGWVVTVDGKAGNVYLGGGLKLEKKGTEEKVTHRAYKTATRVYVNLAEPELAEKVSKMNVDGVGLLRAEFMIANIGIHPKQAIKEKKQEDFIEKLARDLEKFCKAFDGKPVVYRATDFKTNEYRSLPGGKDWEPVEPNPMLGFRGAYRYVSSPEVFNLELQAIKKVREKYKNLWLMIPFARSPQELAKVRRLVAIEGLFDSPTFKFWMMVEIPTNVIMFEEFAKVGIDGISVGSNDLTMLLTGTDRDNSEVAVEFDEHSPALLWSLRRVIKLCHKYKITASICGQAVSTYDDLVEKLVEYGTTSVSVNPDAVERVREVVARAEEKILK